MIDSVAFDALIGLAQVATGLVGFSALVLAVASASAPLNAEQRFQLKEVVRGGLAAIGLAFLPVGISLFGVDSEWVWRSGSGFHFGLMAVAFVLISRETRLIPAQDIDRGMRNVARTGVALCIVLQGSNAIGWPRSPSAGLYFASMLLVLLGCAANFTRILLPRL